MPRRKRRRLTWVVLVAVAVIALAFGVSWHQTHNGHETCTGNAFSGTRDCLVGP